MGRGLIAWSFLSACSLPLAQTGSGSIKLAVAWPQPAFRIHAIPDQTAELQISVSGEGLSSSLDTTLTRDAISRVVQLQVPVGNKQVQVRAFDANGTLLAEDRQTVVIQANQTSRLSMELQLVPVIKPSPSSASGPGEPGGQPSSQPSSPSSNASAEPESPRPSTEPSVTPSVDPSAQPSPQASATSFDGSGGSSSGGGASGGSTTTTTDTMTLSANPGNLSGDGFSTALKFSFTDPNVAADFQTYLTNNPTAPNWTCTDSSSNTGCGSFNSTSDPFVWTWTAASVTGSQFTLALSITGSTGKTYTNSVVVTVDTGTGTVSFGNGGFDGGQ